MQAIGGIDKLVHLCNSVVPAVRPFALNTLRYCIDAIPDALSSVTEVLDVDVLITILFTGPEGILSWVSAYLAIQRIHCRHKGARSSSYQCLFGVRSNVALQSNGCFESNANSRRNSGGARIISIPQQRSWTCCIACAANIHTEWLETIPRSQTIRRNSMACGAPAIGG